MTATAYSSRPATGLRLAICQLNPTVGDLDGNAKLIEAGIEQARAAGAQLVLFGELALTGYPPEDLLLREDFLSDTGAALQQLAQAARGIVAVVGFPERAQGGVYNAAAVLGDGAVSAVYRKMHLPNYGVFDEQRYFKAGAEGMTIDLALGGEDGTRVCRVGLTVCEDLWIAGAPASEEAAAGARLIVNVSASPYHAGKGLERERLFAQRAQENGTWIAFCGLVGGQDELVFDGHSFVLDPSGRTVARARQFEEQMLVCDVGVEELGEGAGGAFVGLRTAAQRQTAEDEERGRGAQAQRGGQMQLAAVHEPIASTEREVYEALLLGLRDYVNKNGFDSVVLGLSGGIDSAMVACLAADALGSERVNVAIMPSPYSSSETQADARALAEALGVRVHELSIKRAMDAFEETLRAEFAGRAADIAEENLQARIRGNLLMALSNKFGWLVLATGNKSEMSVGYSTLYGDLAGGFAVIKDVPKTLVYRLAHWRNSPSAVGTDLAAHEAGPPAGASSGEAPEPGHRSGGARRASAPIPPSIIERAPTAELREGQRDEDSLPPYELLDRILLGYVELDRSREQLVSEGLPEEEVRRVTRMVDSAEYKRRQAPPGIKITERAFGRDRRVPITNAYQRAR